MRKLSLFVLLALMVLGVSSVSALGETNLTNLAQYVEDDAVAFVSMRTDDGFIATIDALVDRVRPFLPEDELPTSQNLTEFLDDTLQDVQLGTFEDTIRPWLGDTAAVAAYLGDSGNMNDPFESGDVIIAIEADGIAALTFFEPFFDEDVQSGELEVGEVGEFTTYFDERESTVIAFGNDAIFITVSTEEDPMDLLPVDNVTNPLSADAAFTTTVSQLPENDYNILIYVNSVQLSRMSMTMMDGLSPELTELLSASGATAIGFTILGEDALTIDIVQNVQRSPLEIFGIAPYAPSAIDFSFTNQAPADTVAIIQTSDFGPTVQYAIDSLETMAAYVQEQGGIAEFIDPDGVLLTERDLEDLEEFDLDFIVDGGINRTFTQLTGLSLESEVLPVLDGDLIAYVRTIESQGFFTPIIPDGAVLFQTSDADGAANIVSQLGVLAEQYDIPVEMDTIGGQEVVVLPADESFGFAYTGLDTILGSSDNLIAVGTRGAVNAAMSNDGGLTDDAIFQEAQNYFLDGTQQLAYIATAPLYDDIDALIESGLIDPEEEGLVEVYVGLSVIESASITSVISDDNLMSTTRLVLSLADTPRTPPVVPDA